MTASLTNGVDTVSVNQTFNPDSTGLVDGTIPVSLSSSLPEGTYTLTLSATDTTTTPAVTQTESVFVQLKSPTFLYVSPNDGSYTSKLIRVRALLKSSGIKSWKVQINGGDVANNTGTTNTVSVDWDSSNVATDGPQTVTITATDLAGNSSTKSITVYIDRVKPTLTIAFPVSGVSLHLGTQLDVVVDVTTPTTAEINQSGLDVILKSVSGQYLYRVSRVSFRSINSTTQRWIGRALTTGRPFPRQLIVVATATDNAGNTATPQQITVTTK